MMRFIGGHVSASGGLDKAAKRAAEIGGNAMQVFTGSPRVWKSKSADEFDYEALAAAREREGIEKAVIHATYLVNLASDNQELVEKSVRALVNDLNVCARGKFEGVVVHVGSHQGRGYEAMAEQMVEAIKRILSESEEGGVFLIENSAGQNGKIASRLEEVADLIDGVGGGNRLGWCVDTCHAHASGIALGGEILRQSGSSHVARSAQDDSLSLFSLDNESNDQGDLFGTGNESSTSNEVKLLAEEIGRLGLWKQLKCVHVNDSKDGFGSGRDRHENLGDGQIHGEDMAEFLNQKELEEIPLLLEVPGIEGKGPDGENIERLKRLVLG